MALFLLNLHFDEEHKEMAKVFLLVSISQSELGTYLNPFEFKRIFA